jgi:hypothetical protein
VGHIFKKITPLRYEPPAPPELLGLLAMLVIVATKEIAKEHFLPRHSPDFQ